VSKKVYFSSLFLFREGNPPPAKTCNFPSDVMICRVRRFSVVSKQAPVARKDEEGSMREGLLCAECAYQSCVALFPSLNNVFVCEK
jgi:hypothetical protein